MGQGFYEMSLATGLWNVRGKDVYLVSCLYGSAFAYVVPQLVVVVLWVCVGASLPLHSQPPDSPVTSDSPSRSCHINLPL